MALPPIPTPPPHSPAAPPTVPAHLVVLCELPCIRCAYDLRTIPLAGRCPECATPAADSLGSLAAANHADIARLRRGLFFAALAAFVCPLAAVGIGTLATFGTRYGGELPGVAAFLTTVCGPIVAWAALFGASAALRSADSSTLPQFPEQLPFLVRLLSGIYALLSSVGFLLVIVQVNAHVETEPGMVLTVAIAFLTGIAWTARNFFACLLFGRLAGRCNSRRTARMFAFLSWVSAAMGAFVLLIGLTIATIYASDKMVPGSADRFGRHLESGLAIVMWLIGAIGWLVAIGWLIVWPIALAIFNRQLAAPERIARAHNGRIIGPSTNPDARFLSPAIP